MRPTASRASAPEAEPIPRSGEDVRKLRGKLAVISNGVPVISNEVPVISNEVRNLIERSEKSP